MQPKPQSFDPGNVPSEVQLPLATLMTSIITHGDVATSERQLTDSLRSSGYPESYIAGALQHARQNSKPQP